MKYFFRVIGKIAGTLRAEYRQLYNRYFGKIQRFDGDATLICMQVTDKLWEGDFYRTSLGHFDFFWMRDFGTVCDALTHMGYEERTQHTIRWALKHYRRAGVVKLCIDSVGNVFNAPARSIDALPWLLHCIVTSRYEMNKKEREFIESQLDWYCKTFLDRDSGMIRPKVVYAEMRDAVIYDRSAYSVALVGRMAKCVEQLCLSSFPYGSELYRAKLLNHYWNGTYFNADIRNKSFSAECALMPFWLGIVDDADMAAKTFDYINKKELNYPYPLKYTTTPGRFTYRWWMTGPFMPNYAGTSVWSWHGVFYLKLLKKYKRDEYKEMHARFTRMIERHGTWPEMLNPDGSWYLAPVYKGDPGMVWAALYLDL